MDAQSCFQSMYADLQRQLNPADISAYLYSARLITAAELEDVDNRMHSDSARASIMLKAVGRAINNESGNFLKFLDILERVDRYKITAQKARKMLVQLSPSPQYPPQMAPKDTTAGQNYEGLLQELFQKNKCPPPEYREIGKTGDPQVLMYTICLTAMWQERELRVETSERKKLDAKKKAAKEMYEMITNPPPPYDASPSQDGGNDNAKKEPVPCYGLTGKGGSTMERGEVGGGGTGKY